MPEPIHRRPAERNFKLLCRGGLLTAREPRLSTCVSIMVVETVAVAEQLFYSCVPDFSSWERVRRPRVEDNAGVVVKEGRSTMRGRI